MEHVKHMPTAIILQFVSSFGVWLLADSGAEVDKFEAFGLTSRPCHKCERPVDQGVLCEFRMPPDQRQPDFDVRSIHLGGS
jgi:hypothetical protein